MQTTKLRRSFVALAGLAVVSAVLFFAGGPAAAIEPPEVDAKNLNSVPERTWGVSGQDPSQTQTQTIDNLVWDFAQIGNRIFVGGAFLNVQETKNSTPIGQPFLAAFDLDTGDWISSWTPQFDRAVYSLDVLPSGSLLVGGEFQTVNGQSREGVVALNPLTGTIDQSFPVSVERPWSTNRAVVREAKVEGSLVYVAGNFSHINGLNGERTRVYKTARVTPAGAIDTGWKPEVTGSGIWGIDTDEARGEVHLVGFFSAVNGEANSGHFHTVNDTTGASAPGKIELPRNYPASQPEMLDVVSTSDRVFVIGEQHIVQVLNPADHAMLGFHTTGMVGTQFAASGFFAGGAYQAGEQIGDVVFAGCHCTYSTRNGNDNHFSSFDGQRTQNRLAMAYDAKTGEIIKEFVADIHSPRDGTWAFGSDTNGCLYIGGDFHVGGVDAGASRWIGGFAKLCGEQAPPDELLINESSTWRYRDDGADLGTAWRESSFDDAAWSIGAAEFGFGDGDETTVVSAGNTTYYARTSFSFTGTKPASLDLRLKADDGAVVYLNGVEVARDNMRAGPVSYTTTSASWRGGSDEVFRQFDISASALVEGENVLAVEVHNIWSGNSDLSFDAALGVSDVVVVEELPPLIELGASWLHTDSTAGVPAGWPNGLDAAPSDNAQFGFGEGDETTIVTTGKEAYYFAHEFEVADAAAITQLDLTTVVDDGAVVYLNGTEVYRTNMPDGPITDTSRPTQWVGTADEAPVTVTIDGAALVEGTNTVTAEVHNFWPGNPDLSFDLGLEIPAAEVPA